MHLSWTVKGMDCPQCAEVLEETVRRVSGVRSASAGFASERLVLEIDDAAQEREVRRAVESLGFHLGGAASHRHPHPHVHGHAAHGHAHPHAHTDSHAHAGHGHAHGRFSSLEMPLAISAGALLAVGWGLLQAGVIAAGPVPSALFALAIATGALFPLRDSWGAVRLGRVGVEVLMVVAAAAAVATGALPEAALLLFLFSLGHALEHRALEKTRHAVEALSALRPETARVLRDGAVHEVPAGEVNIGDEVQVRPGDKVPLDGVVAEGHSAVDQSSITGESVPVAKEPGASVFAGTVNGEGLLRVRVTRPSSQSAVAKMIELVSEAEAQKSPTQRFTERVELRAVPVVLAGAVALALASWLGGAEPKAAVLRAAALLVAASPCALAIATPSAILSAVARAARGGVLIKGGAHLETLAGLEALAFDKTGTLTEGRPRLASIHAVGVSESELLSLAAAVEGLSSHPLARAVAEAAKARGLVSPAAESMEAVHGKGVHATVGGRKISIGNRALFGAVPPAIDDVARAREAEGQTTMLVRRDAEFLGVIGVADALRTGAAEALRTLTGAGITRTVMLSGDNFAVASSIAGRAGIAEARAPLLPEEKVAAIRELGRTARIGMVGDGVNDAPALAAASLGIAMGGAGSDAALESASVVLMGDDLRRLPFAIRLSRTATRVVKQNLAISVGVSAILVAASIGGWARITEAIVVHEGSTLLVVANALRLLAFRDED